MIGTAQEPTTLPTSAVKDRLGILLVLAIALSGCHQYRQQAAGITPAPGVAPESICPDMSRGCTKTVWGVFWGLVQFGKPAPAQCGDVGLAEVTVRTNVAYFLMTVITLGGVAPQHVEWKCAPPDPTPGRIPPASGTHSGKERTDGTE